MQPDLIGNRYRIGRAIGQGGMGTVWSASDEVLHRKVAVKQVGLLPGETVTDSVRAFREARSIAALGHRNVVTVYDVVEEHGRIWLVMEQVEGRSLAQVIEQDGALEPATVADIGRQVAAGLAAAHAAGTTHRDVKPGNVLVTPDGTAKISDFGIARTAGDPAVTQSGLLTGTPSYFSPELARGGEPGEPDDVWALGATLFAAVEGHPPYRWSDNAVGILHEIATAAPPRPRRAAVLAPAIARMMDPDVSTRWTMQDAEHVLGRLAREHRPERTLSSTRPEPVLAPPAEADPAPTRATPAARPGSTPAPLVTPARPRERRPRSPLAVLLVVLGALVLLGVVVTVLALLPDQDRAPSGAREPSRGATPTESPSRSPSESASQSASSGENPSSQDAAAAKEQVVREYYAAAPGGSDAAWARLGPSLQQQGRDRYDAFWRTIRSVQVTSARAGDDGDTVAVTLVYRRADGTTSTERKVETMVADGRGGYLIDTDRPAG